MASTRCTLLHLPLPVAVIPFGHMSVVQLQAFIDRTSHPHYKSVTSSAQAIVSSQGYQGLWLGLAPRAFRLVGATFILNKVRTGIISIVEHRRPLGQP